MKKQLRQEILLDIIKKNQVGTQEELVSLLVSAGVDATQATVSRDVKELDLIKKKKFSKSYHWSLWGYTNLICCGVNTETEQVAVNKVGHDMQAYFKKLFAAQHKKKD